MTAADWLGVVAMETDLRTLIGNLHMLHCTCDVILSRLLQLRECTRLLHDAHLTSALPFLPERLHTRQSVKVRTFGCSVLLMLLSIYHDHSVGMKCPCDDKLPFIGRRGLHR